MYSSAFEWYRDRYQTGIIRPQRPFLVFLSKKIFFEEGSEEIVCRINLFRGPLQLGLPITPRNLALREGDG